MSTNTVFFIFISLFSAVLLKITATVTCISARFGKNWLISDKIDDVFYSTSISGSICETKNTVVSCDGFPQGDLARHRHLSSTTADLLVILVLLSVIELFFTFYVSFVIFKNRGTTKKHGFGVSGKLAFHLNVFFCVAIYGLISYSLYSAQSAQIAVSKTQQMSMFIGRDSFVFLLAFVFYLVSVILALSSFILYELRVKTAHVQTLCRTTNQNKVWIHMNDALAFKF